MALPDRARRRRERGSICLYVAVVLLSMALLFGAVIPLATSMRTRTVRRIDETKARLAFEAGLALIDARANAMTLVVGTPLDIALDGVSGTLTPVALDTPLPSVQPPVPPLPKGLYVTGTMTRNGRSYRFSRVVGMRQPHPFGFALMCNGNLTAGKTVTGSAGAGGDVFSNGNVSMTSNSNVVNGNLAAAGTISTSGSTTITGRRLPNQAKIAWPPVAAADYSNKASSLVLSGAGSMSLFGATLTGLTFTTPLFTSEYPLYYYGGDVTLQGTISGKGTLFVKGNLQINGDLRYASASDRVAIVVTGNVNVSTNANVLDGYLFCGGTFTNSKGLACTRGAWVVGAFSSDKDLTIVRDDAVLLDTDEATRLRLPYYWP